MSLPALQSAVELRVEGETMQLFGGAPSGGCPLHKLVVSWPGWKRLGRGDAGGVPTSIFSAPLWPSSIIPLMATIGRNVRPPVPELVERALYEPHLAQKALAKGNPRDVTLPELKRKLKPHQARAVLALREMGHRAILADEMGLGKTTTAIACSEDCRAERTLVLCPASVKFNWISEIQAVTGEYSLAIDGSRAKRKALFESPLPRYVVLNYDLLPFLEPEQILVTLGMSFLICDESQYLKNKDAKRTRIAMQIAARAKRVLLLTGTPILDTVEDIWSQVELCRPGSWTSFGNFANRHLIRTPVQIGNRKAFMQIRGAKNLPGLNAVVNTLQIRRKKEDVMDLPPKVRTYPELELDMATRKVYAMMRDYAVLELGKLSGDTPIFQPQARSAAEAALRCEQIAQGFVGGVPDALAAQMVKYCHQTESIPGRPGELIFPKASKIVWIREAIESIIAQGGRPIVFGKYNAPLIWLHSKYQDSKLIHGGVSALDRQRVYELFQDGQVPVLFCQVKCGVGFNATRSQDVLFMGRDWSPGRNAQAEDRTHRIGTTGTVNIQVPIVRATIEMKIHKALQAKASDAESALKNMTISELVRML